MILTLTDVDRLVDQELRFKLASLERSATKAGDRAPGTARRSKGRADYAGSKDVAQLSTTK